MSQTKKLNFNFLFCFDTYNVNNAFSQLTTFTETDVIYMLKKNIATMVCVLTHAIDVPYVTSTMTFSSSIVGHWSYQSGFSVLRLHKSTKH